MPPSAVVVNEHSPGKKSKKGKKKRKRDHTGNPTPEDVGN